jgi:hypothetical protein
MKYDIIFQNNGSKELFTVLGVENTDVNPYYLTFEGLELPEGMTYGEYTYVIFTNYLRVEYRFAANLLDSVAIYDGKEYGFRHLKPLVGLMRLGEVKDDAIYNDKNKDNNIFYYEEK